MANKVQRIILWYCFTGRLSESVDLFIQLISAIFCVLTNQQIIIKLNMF